MKKSLIGILALLGSVGMASLAYGGIALSAHDFSTATWMPAGGQICLPCHAPHGGATINDAPLWNHEVTIATYTLYTSPTFDAGATGLATQTQPTGVSLLCLSCHDGTVALDAFGGMAGTDTEKLTGSANLGISLANDHPISFTYDATLVTADGTGLFATTALSNMPGGGSIAADMLYAGKVECASCHDVHNKYGLTALLNVTIDGSALCLTCHNK